MTWETAVALIDRSVPFTLTTVETTNAHLQAVIGYDTLRGTLLVRDPYARNTVEFIAENMVERYKSSGPRGMALVPAEQIALFEGIEFKDVAYFEDLHKLNASLAMHDRVAALQALEAIVVATALTGSRCRPAALSHPTTVIPRPTCRRLKRR